MNITQVLNEMKLNEGYFFSSKYKDKEGLIQIALRVIDTIFSEETAKDIRFGFNRTKFREMAGRQLKKEPNTAGYNNSCDVEGFDNALANYSKTNPGQEKQVSKFRNKLYKRATKALDKPKIYINTKQWKDPNYNDAQKVMTLIHEMIHTVQKYTPGIKKAEKDIYNIYKKNWKGPGPFSLSKILFDSEELKDEAKPAEIFTYLLSDGIYSKYLTEEGVEELIRYLKTCGLINPNDKLGFWKSKFEEMRDDNKA